MSDNQSVPLLGSISLQYVQRIQHELEGGFVSSRIAGLDGEVQQRTGRLSHRILISGMLIGPKAADDLATLQQAALEGKELTFAADITTALKLQQVVISAFRAAAVSGQPNRFSYEVALVESPPLPPPAQLAAFGGLDGFGLDDLGFDTSILGDLVNEAGQIAGAVSDALDVLDKLSALASLGDLSVGNFLAPITQASGRVGDIGGQFKAVGQSFAELFTK